MANPPLPSGASSAEVQQGTIRKYYNRKVREWFGDVDINNELDLSISRHAAYAACRHEDNDSMIQTLLKVIYFNDLRNDIGVDLTKETEYSADVLRKGHPKVTLYFQEQLDQIEDGYAPVTGQISFRLMGEDNNISEATLRALSTKIKTTFNTESNQNWKKGKIMTSYTHWENGYQLQLLVRDAEEGKELVKKVLGLQNHVPDWAKFKVTKNEDTNAAYPTVSQNKIILGKRIRLPRRRPIATVRFQFASVDIPGLPRPRTLVDRSGVMAVTLVDW